MTCLWAQVVSLHVLRVQKIDFTLCINHHSPPPHQVSLSVVLCLARCHQSRRPLISMMVQTPTTTPTKNTKFAHVHENHPLLVTPLLAQNRPTRLLHLQSPEVALFLALPTVAVHHPHNFRGQILKRGSLHRSQRSYARMLLRNSKHAPVRPRVIQ